MAVEELDDEKWFNSLDPFKLLTPEEHQRALRYMDTPKVKQRMIDAIEAGRKALAEIESNPYRHQAHINPEIYFTSSR